MRPSVVHEMRRQNVQFIDPGPYFFFSPHNKTRRKSHKCDNKNEIYEFRLVIYLCANLLSQGEDVGATLLFRRKENRLSR